MLSKEKDYISNYNKEYQQKNKDELKTKRMVREPCPKCNKLISHSYITKHQKTPICKKNSVEND
jgi:hypothetical protein